ncbi:MAG: hypothetical protein KAG84_01235 [Bacteroidales bacterium]|nr:hypothetical protein [Bacteroidales bacterium]
MKILVIHEVHPILETLLTDHDHTVDYKMGLSRENIIDILPSYDGLVVRSALKVDKQIINAGTQLKFIARLGAGMEGIDVVYASSKHIILYNAPEGNRSAVGEQSVGMLLSLFNNLNRADSEVRNGIWVREANRGEEIQGKIVAIIGYGNMGSAFAEKICGFGATVIAYDKYKKDYANEFVKECSLKEVFEKAEVVSLHTPLQNDTFHMVNKAFLNSFHKEITLINTSRGAVVNTPDLVDALKNGKVKGACLDVIEYEGMSFEAVENTEDKAIFDYLKKSDKVILSPHIAGWTHQSNERMARILAEKILRIY